MCPKEVYEEVIEIGVINGYPDAILIRKEVFQSRIVHIKKIVKNIKIKGISDVDCSVLLLARENNAIILTDDIRLRKKSDEAGIVNVNTPELLVRCFDEEQYQRALKSLVSHKRLSTSALKYYLEVKSQWEKK